MPLYGNELDRDHQPLRGGPRAGREAVQGRATSWAAPRSSGSSRDGVQRQLVGLEIARRGIARHGYPVLAARAEPPATGLDRDQRARCRRRSGRRSRWPTCRRRRRDPVRCWPWRSGRAGGRRGRAAAVLQAPGLEPGEPPDADDGGARLMVPDDLRFTKEHEWVRLDGDEATVGITAVRRGPAGRHRVRRAAGRRPRRSSSSRRSAWSSPSRPSATCSHPWPAR